MDNILVGIQIPKEISDQQLTHLIDTAKGLGASDAKRIFSSEITIEEHLASLCKNAPQCENFGLSSSCPPHVQGPSGFRKWQSKSTYSIVVKIDLPTEIMFSSERHGIMQLLHEIVANVEREAIEMGFNETRAFAGGSCKDLFCKDQDNCRVITGQGSCRNPDVARPSMSGFGIHVTKLVQSAGWPLTMTRQKEASDKQSLSWIAGLILIAGAA
jgi:predicted metal-binding protein